MNGLLHVHSENSLKDCALRIPDIVKTAKDMGFEAVALTDADSMTGIAEFINSADSAGIKPVPGVELSVERNGETAFIVLMAKDYTGYIGLCKALSTANRKLVNESPVLSFDSLASFFGKNGKYHGHVWACSGGEGGIFWNNACIRAISDMKIRSLNAGLSEKEKEIRDFELPKDDPAVLESEIYQLEQDEKALEPRTGKNFSHKEEMLKKMKGTDLYQETLRGLEEEKADCRIAEAELKRTKSKLSVRRSRLKEAEQKREELQHLKDEAEGIKSSIIKEQENAEKIDDEGIYADILETAEAYNDLFGQGNFFIELMYHGADEELEELPILTKLAEETGMPTLISNDVHILRPTKEDALQRRLIQALKDNKWVESKKYDMEYCIKTEEELSDVFAGLVPDDMIEASFKNADEIFDEASFDRPEGRHYPKYEDPMGRDAGTALTEEARKNIPLKFKGHSWTKAYEDRLNYELSVIIDSGYADYTMIISEILREGRKGPNDGKPGYYIGPGRGSGVGSLVNYLLDITSLDPMKYGLIFERYLNKDRLNPPDIDSDIATSTRPMLVKYITDKYSKKDSDSVGVCSIVTKSRLTARDAVRAAGRIAGSRNNEKFYDRADKIARKIPMAPNTTLESCRKDFDEFKEDQDREIIYYARLIENVLSKYGTHAAGIIISDSGDVTDYAPVMNTGTNEEPEWTIQFDKDQSEQIGLLKLDALGLSTLDIISQTMQLVQDDTGIEIPISSIPFEKKVFREIYAKGNTVGVFQCKSYGMRRMWKEMQPDNINDIIAGIALYRPGPMDFIPKYIEGKKNPHVVEYITPELEPILKDTYGTIVYQEQVMRIVRDLAGYSMGRSDLVRRAMAKKKQAVMDEERQNFIYGNKEEGIPGCINKGISEEKASAVWDLMADFAKYAFNKSHAAAYAVLSYQSAWLKYYYPKEFLTACLNIEKTDNIPLYVEECRRMGFAVLPPDVNKSKLDFSVCSEGILYGLGNVKGVRNGAEPIIKNRQGNPYLSFADYLMRSEANSGTTRALIMGGAFDMFCRSRRSLMMIYDKLSSTKPAGELSRYKSIKKRLTSKQEKLESGNLTQKEYDRTKKGAEADRKKLDESAEKINAVEIPAFIEDSKEELLKNEKSVLSAYLSEHPMDRYMEALEDAMPISEAKEQDYIKIAGLVKEMNRFKKNGEEMAVFMLEDKTGSIKVFCGIEQTKAYSKLLQNDLVIIVSGKCRLDRKDADSKVVYMHDASRPNIRVPQTVLYDEDLGAFNKNLIEKVKPYIVDMGSEAFLMEKKTGKIIPLDFYLKEGLEDAPFFYSRPTEYIKGGGFHGSSEEQDDSDGRS